MIENPQSATVPEQPKASAQFSVRTPAVIVLFVLLGIFVVSSAVNAARKTAPLKSQLTAKPAAANPQQVNSFETQQEQVAKRDQEEQQQRAATAALLAQIQGADAAVGPEAPGVPPMTPAQRAAMYGPANPNAPQTTSQASQAQAEAKQSALTREKQRQDAVNSDTVAVDFARSSLDVVPDPEKAMPTVVASLSRAEGEKPATDPSLETGESKKPAAKDAAFSKYDFDAYSGGKLYRVFEGGVFEGVVTNHIDGGIAGPILIMLTTDYYSHDHQQLLLPQGTRLIGNVQSVSNSQERKLVVAFHRAICPDGFSVDLDKFAGLDPLGTTGLATKVDNRYFQTFAVAAAIGGLGGLAQVGNNASILSSSGELRNGISSQSSQEAEQILNHFLNRLPIITLKEGSRARVYIGRDILIPSYAEHSVDPTL